MLTITAISSDTTRPNIQSRDKNLFVLTVMTRRPSQEAMLYGTTHPRYWNESDFLDDICE